MMRGHTLGNSANALYRQLCQAQKAVTKKLAGEAAGTAAWVTDVGNEFGQALMCVLTVSEGDSLLAMCSGIVECDRRAGEALSKVLYVDRDCCSTTGKSKAADVCRV
ncbi:hypothetical protein ROHU_003065 [Labeo rohita]|nr:hypothetical protein ROHU_003065 [Labeo rohita]